jgi:hypothetical protein
MGRIGFALSVGQNAPIARNNIILLFLHQKKKQKKVQPGHAFCEKQKAHTPA